MLPFEPSAEEFDWMVRFISRTFTVLPLGEAASRLKAGTLPPAAAAITFDDGYADNLLVAWPILKRYGVPATFFIATSFLEGGRMWNDDVIEAFRHIKNGALDLEEFDLGTHKIEDITSRVGSYEAVLRKLKYFKHSQRTEIAAEIARRCNTPRTPHLMMTHQQLRCLHEEGAEIGGHTHSHPILELLNDNDALREIESGKQEVESIIGEQIRVFAYPNGAPNIDYSARHGEMAQRVGFEAAVTTAPAYATLTSDVYQLARFTPWDRTELRFKLRTILHLSR